MAIGVIRTGLLGVAFVVAAPALGAATIIGGGQARDCYYAAEFNRPLKPSLEACNAALETESMSLEQRASTYVNRGIVHMHARNLTAAIQDYDQALKISTTLAEAYVNKGIALVHLGGRDEEAVALLTKGLALEPNRPEIAYYTRGIAHELIGQTRQAYEDFKKAAELKPDWSEAIAQLQRFSVIRKPVAGA